MSSFTNHIAGPYKAKPEDAPYYPISIREKSMLNGTPMDMQTALDLLVNREVCLPNSKHPAVREAYQLKRITQ
jgi:hypothetical protein